MINTFLQGAVAMGWLVAGVFFLRFWQQSQDRLFLQFAFAFWLLAFSSVMLGTIPFATESRVDVFVVRLVAYALILVAIIDHTRSEF